MKKQYSMNELVQVLIDNGYRAVGWKGSHLRMQRGDRIVHVGRNTMLNRHYAHTILRKAEVDFSCLDEDTRGKTGKCDHFCCQHNMDFICKAPRRIKENCVRRRVKPR